MSSPEAMMRSQGGQTPKTCPKPTSQELLSQLLSSTTGSILAASCQTGREIFPHTSMAKQLYVSWCIFFPGIVLKGFP